MTPLPPSPPPIARPLDASRYATKGTVCDLLTDTQAVDLGLQSSGNPYHASDGSLLTCNRNGFGTERDVEYNLWPDSDVFASQFGDRRRQGGDDAYLVDVAGQPAVVNGSDPKPACQVTVGLTDRQGIEVLASDGKRSRGSGVQGLLAATNDAAGPRSRRPPTLNPLAPKAGHFPAKAKSVIWLFMNGGPSQVDTWDYKPELDKRDGKELEGFDKNTGFFTGQVGPLMKSPFKFAQHGQCGHVGLGDLPEHGRSTSTTWRSSTRCYTETNNHSPALFKINTGMSRMGFPCVGSWVTYGLGTREPEPARRSS